jgi:hypothetical protein
VGARLQPQAGPGRHRRHRARVARLQAVRRGHTRQRAAGCACRQACAWPFVHVSRDFRL